MVATKQLTHSYLILPLLWHPPNFMSKTSTNHPSDWLWVVKCVHVCDKEGLHMYALNWDKARIHSCTHDNFFTPVHITLKMANFADVNIQCNITDVFNHPHIPSETFLQKHGVTLKWPHYKAPQLWNNLPVNIQDSDTVSVLGWKSTCLVKLSGILDHLSP